MMADLLLPPCLAVFHAAAAAAAAVVAVCHPVLPAQLVPRHSWP
jgi:hypothetical protein